MLSAFGFRHLCVAVSDLYLLDPEADQGAEQGVRLELRTIERQPSPSIFAAASIVLGRPIWRVDLLESVDNPGSLDRAHHHTQFDSWEPNDRQFVADLSVDPLAWVGGRLANLGPLLDEIGLSGDDPAREDVDDARAAVDDVLHAVQQALEGVRSGKLARPPDASAAGAARVGWL
jgi:hypothetical protein